MSLFEFEIPAHTTRREWAVYIIIATDQINQKKFLYVGKVGDNREGCNPIISRVGNHFSHNRIHSQLRNKITETTNFNYHIHYTTFGLYNETTHSTDREKINEVERRLNTIVQSKLETQSSKIELLNIYKGVGVNKETKGKRELLLTKDEIQVLQQLADKALGN